MTIADDPIDYAEVDSAGGNSAALPLAQSINGWNGGDFLEHDKLNAVMGNAAEWKRWLDQTRPPGEQLGYSSTFRTSVGEFRYGVAAGLADRPVLVDSHYVVEGRYVPLTLDRLQRYSPTINTYTFTATSTHHFYVDGGGVVEAVVKALGTPPEPGVGQVWLYSADTDATEVVSEVAGDDFTTPLVRNSAQYEHAGPVTIRSSLTVDGGNVTIDKADGGSRRVELSVDNDNTRGWRVNHTSAERLQLQEMLPAGGGGSATTILDLGAGPLTAATAAASLVRPLAITSAETSGGLPALAIVCSDLLGPGATISVQRTQALTLTASGTGGVPLVLVPRSPGFVGGAPVGSIEIGDDAASHLQFKDANGVTRTAWATEGGAEVDDAFTLANVDNFAGATVAQSFNYSFVNGRSYLVRMACRVGRAAGSTRDALFTCTVGGAALAYSGQVVQLFQAGAASQLEARFEGEVLFTATSTATLAVQLLVTPSGGAGNLNIGARHCRVLGHF